MTKLSAELLVKEEAEESEAEVEAVESPHNLSPERVTLPRALESSQVTLPSAPESSQAENSAQGTPSSSQRLRLLAPFPATASQAAGQSNPSVPSALTSSPRPAPLHSVQSPRVSFSEESARQQQVSAKTPQSQMAESANRPASAKSRPAPSESAKNMKQLDEIKALTMHGMVDASGDGKRLVFLTHYQASLFSVETIPMLLEAFDIKGYKLVITFLPAKGGTATLNYGMIEKFKGLSKTDPNYIERCKEVLEIQASRDPSTGIKQDVLPIAPFADEQDLYQAEWKLECFMRDVLVPLAAETQASVALSLAFFLSLTGTLSHTRTHLPDAQTQTHTQIHTDSRTRAHRQAQTHTHTGTHHRGSLPGRFTAYDVFPRGQGPRV